MHIAILASTKPDVALMQLDAVAGSGSGNVGGKKEDEGKDDEREEGGTGSGGDSRTTPISPPRPEMAIELLE